MTTIACVLRSGGDYGPEWFHALEAGVMYHTLLGHDFDRLVCLTDILDGHPLRVPLREGWPGWFSKIELFRPGLFPAGELVLYLDLDTLVLGDLSPLLSYEGEFAMLSDFYAPDRAESGVMLFRLGEQTERIWQAFVRDPWANIHRYRRDGKFVAAHAHPDRIQDIYPGLVRSFKVHAKHAPPEGAALVCGHGRPRFSSPAAGWAHEHWKGLVGVAT